MESHTTDKRIEVMRHLDSVCGTAPVAGAEPIAKVQFVSLRTFLITKAVRIGKDGLGVALGVIAVLCVLALMILIANAAQEYQTSLPTYFQNKSLATRAHPLPLKWWITTGQFVYGLVAIIYASAKGAAACLRDEIKKEKIIPITRANTADLPAPDSLVRASSEPLQAQDAVLLRAVEERQEKHEEQLLRAITE